MRKLVSFMHISLDGFVAGPKGEMDWIKVDEEIFDHIGKRIAGCDTAMYGRVTFQMMENYWPNAADKPNASKHDKDHSGWYNAARKVVLSRTLKPVGLKNTVLVAENLLENIQEIKQQPGSEILLFGSPSATHSLIQLDLIDGYWLFVNPIVLGKGIPLFAGIERKIRLKSGHTRQFASGVTELNFALDRS